MLYFIFYISFALLMNEIIAVFDKITRVHRVHRSKNIYAPMHNVAPTFSALRMRGETYGCIDE